MITVPVEFTRYTTRREGEAGRAWIEGLPRLVAELCDAWGLAVDGAPMHGGMGLVVPVTRGGEPYALKVGWADESTADEALALKAWDGNGAVRLLAADPACGALLLERLDHTRSLLDVRLDEAVAVAAGLLRRLAIPAPEGVRTLRIAREELSRTLPERWEALGRPFPRSVVEWACDHAATQAASSGSLLVNYDLHYADVLAGRREPWLAIDPKVVSGDLEYGVAQLLWRRLDEMQAQGGLERHFQALVVAAELDEALTRAWTLVRCVDYWLWALSVGLTEDPDRCRAIVEWLM